MFSGMRRAAGSGAAGSSQPEYRPDRRVNLRRRPGEKVIQWTDLQLCGEFPLAEINHLGR